MSNYPRETLSRSRLIIGLYHVENDIVAVVMDMFMLQA